MTGRMDRVVFDGIFLLYGMGDIFAYVQIPCDVGWFG